MGRIYSKNGGKMKKIHILESWKFNKNIIYQPLTSLKNLSAQTQNLQEPGEASQFFCHSYFKSSRFENSTEQNTRGAHHVPDLSILEKFPQQPILHHTNFLDIQKGKTLQ